ncbi:MAG: ABC transporter ATP-binding protein [Solirubrobacterales bacterium]
MQTNGEAVIEVRGLRKSYGELEAVRGIELEVHAGEVFAFLGPNGAGKTTTVEILEGYRPRSAGEVSVLGLDPAAATRAWRERIGIVLQECRMQPELTVHETLELYAGYYRAPRAVAETIGLVGLEQKADDRVAHLSGGQQRRLDVGVALIGDPDLLFLDEPTTGFDPSARRQAWGMIASLRQLGKTVFLTTHYMDEAQRLADRAAIIAGGRIVAEGAPEKLGDRESQPTEVSFRLPSRVEGREPPLDGAVAGPDGTWTVTSDAPVELLHRLTGWALDRGIELERLEVRRPSLEDVYLELTGADRVDEPEGSR